MFDWLAFLTNRQILVERSTLPVQRVSAIIIVSVLVMGGDGVVAGSDNDKSQQNLHSIMVDGDKVEPQDFVEVSMHAASRPSI